MTLENNFINHSKEYIFSDNKILSNQRESKFKKIFQKNYDKKNNESLKNITITDLSKFDYFYKPIKKDPTVSLTGELSYEIKLINGIFGIIDTIIQPNSQQIEFQNHNTNYVGSVGKIGRAHV